jgi:hypothetical protein
LYRQNNLDVATRQNQKKMTNRYINSHFTITSFKVSIMQTFQHLLIFLFQFTVFSSIAVITVSFVNYVSWSVREATAEVASPDRVTNPNLNISSIVVDRASAALRDAKGTLCARILENETIVEGSTQSASAIELLCIDDESIEDRDNSDIIDVVESNLAPQVVHIEAADLTCIELSTITLRQARKIAKKLGIKQKVNGKDAPKDWLVKQIEQKLPEKPDSNKIISELLAA